jgi:DNA-binding protein H-NS
MVREKYISILRKAAEENGGEISYKKYENQKYSPSASTISTYFGSWTKALQAAGLKTNEKFAKNYSKEEIIKALQRYAEENDGFLTYDLYRNKKYKPSDTTIRKKFGSWNQALREAGIMTNREVEKWYTEEEVLRILQNVSENGKAITIDEYKKQKIQPNFDTIVALFGSWNEAIKKAGLKENSVVYTDEEMIKALQKYSQKKGKFTSLDYVKDRIQPSYPAIQQRFGSWANAVKNAGIEPTYVYYTDLEILHEIKRCLDETKADYITIADYERLSNHPHSMTIYKRFGSWKKAVELAKRYQGNSK